MRVNPLASCTGRKSGWSMVEVTIASLTIKAALAGVGSEALQFGPREPINEVFPKRTLSCTVKLQAEVIAMPYPNAPVR